MNWEEKYIGERGFRYSAIAGILLVSSFLGFNLNGHSRIQREPRVKTTLESISYDNPNLFLDSSRRVIPSQSRGPRTSNPQNYAVVPDSYSGEGKPPAFTVTRLI